MKTRETLSIRIDAETKKKFADYLDLHFPLLNKETKQSQFKRFLNYVFKNLELKETEFTEEDEDYFNCTKW